MSFAGQQCTGLGCLSRAIITYGDEKAPREQFMEQDYPSSSDIRHLGSPQAAMAKALLQLGKKVGSWKA